MAPRLAPLAESLPFAVPFTGPETMERQSGQKFRARLGANESLFGPSSYVAFALASATQDVWMYGDPDCYDLKTALASHHAIAPGHIVPGEGIDGLLGLICRLMIGPGDIVVTSNGAYPTFNFHATGYGGVLIKVPYVGNHEDPQSLLETARTTRAKLIYLANPDNPMGSFHSAAVIEEMVAQLPETCLLILDEAYADLAPEGSLPIIAEDHPNVIRLRTFSKAHGLAGLRVGYAICAEPLARAFDRVRNHFGLGRLAQVGALAALADTDWLEQVQAKVIAARARVSEIALSEGLVPLPSATNFVTIDCGQEGPFARKVLQGLLAEGIFVRMPGVAPLDRCIRVSLGDDAALDAFAEALPIALLKARAKA